MSKIIGIDLGTTNSLVAVNEGDKAIVIAGKFGNFMKSAVRIDADGNYQAGNTAFDGRVLYPGRTITSIKRFIGRKFHEVFDLAEEVPYQVTIGPQNMAYVSVFNRLYSPQVISAMILKALKETAEEYLGAEVTEAIITIPAYFNERQKKATIEAGELAGLTVRRIIPEPNAAAMAYGFDKEGADMKIAVFDLGGGTFDISILELGDGVYEVKSVSGDGALGGDDFDNAMETWILSELLQRHGVRADQCIDALPLIRDAAQKAKIDLSVSEETTILFPLLPVNGVILYDITLTITRGRFEEICEELFERLVPPCEEALKQACITGPQIDRVILVGGATRMPKVQEMAEKIFGRPPTRSINPEEAVALGAAIQGAVLMGEIRDVLLLDVVPLPLGLADANGRMLILIDANTTIPTKKSEIFTTIEDNQTSIEVVVLEGDNVQGRNNRRIGRVVFEGITPEPAGGPRLEVVFDLDPGAILHVTIRDRATGKETKQRISRTTGLSEKEKARGITFVRDIGLVAGE
jgi:molecular chaperone DnaK